MRILAIIGVLAIVTAGGALAAALSGWVDVSATTDEPAPLHWLLETSRESAVRRQAADIGVPDLSGEGRVIGGADAFKDMCAGCHGAPGVEPEIGARDMNPPPPDLVEVARERSPAELFWIIKHGIRMTGMPA